MANPIFQKKKEKKKKEKNQQFVVAEICLERPKRQQKSINMLKKTTASNLCFTLIIWETCFMQTSILQNNSKKLSYNIREIPSDMCTQQRFWSAMYSRSLIRTFTGCILDSQGCKVSLCWQCRLWSDCTDMQTDLSLHWAHVRWYAISHCGSIYKEKAPTWVVGL